MNSGTARQAQLWDTTSGKIVPWTGTALASGKTTLPLELPAKDRGDRQLASDMRRPLRTEGNGRH